MKNMRISPRFLALASISCFAASKLRAFGLSQRDRLSAHEAARGIRHGSRLRGPRHLPDVLHWRDALSTDLRIRNAVEFQVSARNSRKRWHSGRCWESNRVLPEMPVIRRELIRTVVDAKNVSELKHFARFCRRKRSARRRFIPQGRDVFRANILLVSQFSSGAIQFHETGAEKGYSGDDES